MKRQILGKIFAAALLATPLPGQEFPETPQPDQLRELSEDRARLIKIVQDLQVGFRETLDGYQDLQKEFAELQKTKADAMPAAEVSKLRQELDLKAAHLAELQAGSNDDKKTLAATRREQDLFLFDIHNLRRELQAERDQLRSARSDIGKLREIEKSVPTLEKQAAQADQANAKLRTEIETLKSARPAMEEKARMALAKVATEKNNLAAKVGDLQTELTAKTARLNNLETTAADLKTVRLSLADREKELAAARKEMGLLHLKSEAAEKQLIGLKVRLAEIAPVSYGLGEAGVEGQQERVLSDLRECLAMFPQARFEIVGHTCDIGDKAANQALSEKRARSLAAFLIENGVPEKIVKARGEGDANPLVPNTSDENRKKNRRVEIQILD